MKLSRKLVLAFSGVLIVFSLLLILFENIFLDIFFIHQKRETLINTALDVQEIVENSDFYKDENGATVGTMNMMFEINDLSINTGLSIYIFDLNGEKIDNRPGSVRRITDFNIRVKDYGKLDSVEAIDNFVKDGGKIIEFKSDRQSNLTDIAFLGRTLKNGECVGYVFIFTTYASVRANTGIFNAFTTYLTLILLIVTCVGSLFISKGFVKPLKEAEEKTRKMAALDFSTKLDVKSKDEIGSLSISINKMSDELEKSINSLREANIALEKDIKLKERINNLREEFISDVSHELKTPISIIEGYSEALKLEGLTQEDVNSYADIIIDESKRMDKLVKDLLKFTQIESGFLSLDREEFQILEMINLSIKPFELKIKDKNINLDIDVEDVQVVGDYDMMESVFSNIFNNAINHVEGEEKTIRVKGESKDNKFRITIFNSGSFISEDNQSRIFDSFYKIDKSRSRQYGGSGLGLAIVKSIMETYGNEYGVYNTSCGVCFYFDLDLEDKKV